MKQISLYIDSNKAYWYVVSGDQEVICDSCGAELLDRVFIRVVWGRSSQLGLLCSKCTNNPVFDAQIEEWKIAKICYIKKIDFTPVLIIFGGIKNTERDLSVFDVEKINAPITIDRTKFAGRESWAGSQIGASITPELEKLDKALALEEGLDFFNDLSKSEILLPEFPEDIKQIEEDPKK